jgi:hypothetical protein
VSRIDILTPATITVFADNSALVTLSSLDSLPPYGIDITDPSGGTFTVTLVTGNTLASLTASGADGAAVSQNLNTLTVTGDTAQVNAALSSLEITEPQVGADDLAITVNDPLELIAQTTLAIASVSTLGPAFDVPPLQLTFAPEMLDPIGGILLSDPIENGLAEMGLGAQGTLLVILSVLDGVLVLPGYNPAGGIAATGLGTGSIALTATANELGALNALLAGLEYVGTGTVANGGSIASDELEISAQNVNGVLPSLDDSSSFGRVFLRLKGNAGTANTLIAGTQTIGLPGASLSGVLSVAGELVMQSSVGSAVTLTVGAGAGLDVTQATLTLAGTSLDFGAVQAPQLDVNGALLVADGMSLLGPAVIGTAGYVNANGLIDLLAGETIDGALALSLAAGGVFAGDGTLELGNFGGAGVIEGPGTILAGGGDTLLVVGDSIGGGTQLEVAPGGVMVLGSGSALYGIFDTVPLTIDNSVTLTFLGTSGAQPITGNYAGTLADTGGAFVITGAEAFSGTVSGFVPGDALIFPGLSGLSIDNESASGFGVIGSTPNNSSVSYSITATTPSGDTPAIAYDAAGDPEIIMRPSLTSTAPRAIITVPDAYNLTYLATSGTAQPLVGMELELFAPTTQSLSLTLTTSHGTLTEGALSGPKITISAANLQIVNEMLANVAYTGTGVNDMLTISSANIAGSSLSDVLHIVAAGAGTVNAYMGLPFTEAQTASFALTGSLFEANAPVAAGDVLVTGTVAFSGLLLDNGLSGTALHVDAGGDAIFDAAAQVTLGAGATIGDAGGAGSLAILTANFIDTGNLILAATNAGAGSGAYVMGSLGIGGSLVVGQAGRAGLVLGGTLSGAQGSIGSAGSLLAMGSAALNLSMLTDAGLMVLENDATVTLGSLALAGGLDIGGTAAFNVGGQASLSAGASLSLGVDAILQGAGLTDIGGTMQLAGQMDLSGTLALGGPATLAGGTLLAANIFDTGTVFGYGVVTAPTMTNAGNILATGGTLALDGSLTNAGVIYVETGAALDLIGAESGTQLYFLGTDARLIVNDPLLFTGGASALMAGDAIDLIGVAPSLVSYAAGAVTISGSAGQSLSSFLLDQPLTTGVKMISDGAGGTDVTINGQLPCFARGTRLLTPQGYRAVETLRPGDPVITAAGARRPVRWLGWRTLDLGGARHRDSQPVQIEVGAFGQGIPSRPVVLSPQHAVCVPGALIPVGHLVNGVTVRRLPASAVTYYHVELDRHDALLAEGLACESYFDDGNRGGLYREIGRRSPAARPMAPYTIAGSRLTSLRRLLHERVLLLGYSTTYAPRLNVIANGQPAASIIDADRFVHIEMTQAARQITLISPAQAPAETAPQSQDYRPLSLCFAPAAGLGFSEGFYKPDTGDMGRWMGATGVIDLTRPCRTLTLKLAAVAQSWTVSSSFFEKNF